MTLLDWNLGLLVVFTIACGAGLIIAIAPKLPFVRRRRRRWRPPRL